MIPIIAIYYQQFNLGPELNSVKYYYKANNSGGVLVM